MAARKSKRTVFLLQRFHNLGWSWTKLLWSISLRVVSTIIFFRIYPLSSLACSEEWASSAEYHSNTEVGNFFKKRCLEDTQEYHHFKTIYIAKEHKIYHHFKKTKLTYTTWKKLHIQWNFRYVSWSYIFKHFFSPTLSYILQKSTINSKTVFSNHTYSKMSMFH